LNHIQAEANVLCRVWDEFTWPGGGLPTRIDRHRRSGPASSLRWGTGGFELSVPREKGRRFVCRFSFAPTFRLAGNQPIGFAANGDSLGIETHSFREDSGRGLDQSCPS
jgi:hypothetical protein